MNDYADEEERNFCSLVLLLLRVGTPCLRNFFKNQWDSSRRSARTWTDSTQNGADVIRIYTPLPYERNSVQSGDRSTWDLSLVIKVLLQSRPPFVSTPGLVSALEKLRELRNKVCHATAPRIETNDFKGFWTDACSALALFGAKSKDFDKVKRDVKRTRKFLLPEVKGCATQERDILLLLESINSEQKNLLLGQQRILEEQRALSQSQKAMLEVMSTIQSEQQKMLDGQTAPRQSQISTMEHVAIQHEQRSGQQEIQDGQTAPRQTQRTPLEARSPNRSTRTAIQEGDSYVTFCITAMDSSHIAVGDNARVTTHDVPPSEQPASQTVDTTRQRKMKGFTHKLKSSIKQQTDSVLPRQDRKIRTDDIFTNMTIQRDPERFTQTTQAQRSARKTEYKMKSEITLLKKCSELFICPDKEDSQSKVGSSNSKFILLIGKAGIGKSLFCRKIVRDWADDKLFEDATWAPDFQFAFLLTFRQLNSLGDKALTLQKILNHSPVLDDHSIIDDDVFEKMSANPEKVLVILDGYDEYAHCKSIVGDFETNYPNDPKEEMPVPASIAKLLKGKIWSDCAVLVTSRPGEGSVLARNVFFDAHAEIKGFSSRQVLDYVTKYFLHDEVMKDAVLGHILGNENLVRFGHIPVMCYLMCYYMEWQIAKREIRTSLPKTRTELYHKVIKMFIKEHHAHLKSKQGITEEELEHIINRLAAVAVKLTGKKKFLFSEDDLKKLGICQEEITSLKASGLLDCWPPLIKKPLTYPYGEVSLEYTFSHLTLQEYLSAFCYVQMKVMPDKDKTTDVTFVFVAEMLSRNRDKKLMEKLLKAIKPADENDDTKRLLTLHCLQGFGDKDFATRKIAKMFENFCNQNGWVVFSGVTDMDCPSIAYLFDIIKSLREESKRQKKITKKSFVVNTLYIFNSHLTSSGVRHICNSLVNSTVTELELNRCGIDDSLCVQIITNLFQSKVAILNLPYNYITGEHVAGIYQALVHEDCQVKSINLCGNRLAEGLPRVLTSPRFAATQENL